MTFRDTTRLSEHETDKFRSHLSKEQQHYKKHEVVSLKKQNKKPKEAKDEKPQ